MNQWKTKRLKKKKKKTNNDVLEEIEENYLRSYSYVKAHVNVLDEVP
jgi:hypothetical protein